MIIINSKEKSLKNDKTTDGEDSQIARQKDKMPIVQYVTETRIRKYRGSKNVHTPSLKISSFLEYGFIQLNHI